MSQEAKNIEIPDIALWYFYKEIILFYERAEEDDLKGFPSINPDLANFLTITKIALFSLNSKDILAAPNSYKSKEESFIFLKPTSKDNHKLSIWASFIKHLRNSFSHGHYSMISFNGTNYLCLEDYNPKKRNQLSMVAQIPYIHFILLIELIKKSKKQS